MDENFILDKILEEDTFAVGELSLSTVRVMNDSRYPWLILIPKRASIAEIFELSGDDRIRLMEEANFVARSLDKLFNPTKINVAALGNMVRQLHVHVIARFDHDYAWPKPVWGIGDAVAYNGNDAETLVSKIRTVINQA